VVTKIERKISLIVFLSFFRIVKSDFWQHRTTGDDPPGEGWLAIPTEGEGLVKEVRERTVHSKEEQRELMETEDAKVLGDLSDQVSHACAKHGTVSLICIL